MIRGRIRANRKILPSQLKTIQPRLSKVSFERRVAQEKGKLDCVTPSLSETRLLFDGFLMNMVAATIETSKGTASSVITVAKDSHSSLLLVPNSL